MKKSHEVFDEAQKIIDLAKKEERDLSPEEDSKVAELLNEGKALAKREAMIAEVEKAQVEAKESRGRIYQPKDVELPKDEKRGYSILRALRRLAAGKAVDGLEGEISQELAKRYGKETQGFFVPPSFRALDATTGAGAVPTTTTDGMIDILRNKMVCIQAGATVLSDLSGNGALRIPKQTGAGTAYWVGESTDTTASNQTISYVELTPNTVGAYTDISRHFLLQSSVDAEMFVRNDLSNVLALAIDYAALYGDGTGEPLGLLRNTNTNLVTCGDGTNGDALDYADIVKMETEVAVDNADFGSMAYIVTPRVRGYCKSKDISSSDGTVATATGRFMWEQGNTLNGYPVHVTNQMPGNLTVGSAENCQTLLFGNFSQLIIGFWSPLQIVVDPYSLAKQGGLRVVALQDVDTVCGYDKAFRRIVDAVVA